MFHIRYNYKSERVNNEKESWHFGDHNIVNLDSGGKLSTERSTIDNKHACLQQQSTNSTQELKYKYVVVRISSD